MREIPTGLRAILDSLTSYAHTTLDIALVGVEEPLHFSSAEMLLSASGVMAGYLDADRTYRGVMGKDDIDPLDLSLMTEADQMTCRVGNVDLVFGQALSGAANPLGGNLTTVGTLFPNPDVTIASGSHWWDARMPARVETGEISGTTVAMQVTSLLDIGVVIGRTIADEFPWREPLSIIPTDNPDDLPGPGADPDRRGPVMHGRYPDPDGPMPLMP